MMEKIVLSPKEECFNYMELFDDSELPDGAWQQILEDAVNRFNEERRTEFDSFDMFLEYCERNQN